MRTTLSIPDNYYLKIKKALPDTGYQTVNELLLDLLRHHFDAGGNGIKKPSHQIDAKPQEKKVKVTIDGKPAPAATAEAKLCKHGYLPRMCKFEECRKRA